MNIERVRLDVLRPIVPEHVLELQPDVRLPARVLTDFSADGWPVGRRRDAGTADPVLDLPLEWPVLPQWVTRLNGKHAASQRHN